MTLHNTIATMNRNLNREGFMIHNDRQPAAWPTGTQSRRAFLAAGTLFGFRMAAGAKPTAKYRVGVIGCGRKGTQHARCYDLNPLSEVVAAADIDPDNLDLFCKRFGVKGYRDYREMLRKEKIDIAAPVLPTKINPSIVLGCTEFPIKAILCEKPMAVALEEADRLVEACRKQNIVFGAGDMYRNYSQMWKARDVIHSGEIGTVQSINLYQPTDEISGGGCQGLSAMRLFADDAEVAWVTGWVKGDPFSDDDQGMGGYVRFTNGVEGFIHNKPTPKNGFEVLCERGLFYTDWREFKVWKVKDGQRPGRLKDMEEMEGLLEDSRPFGSHYDDEGWLYPGSRNIATIQSMIDALEKGIEPRSTGDNGRKVLEMAVALRESHRRDHQPINLPIQDRSLGIVPRKSRLLDKKKVYGEEWYEKQIMSLKKP